MINYYAQTTQNSNVAFPIRKSSTRTRSSYKQSSKYDISFSPMLLQIISLLRNYLHTYILSNKMNENKLCLFGFCTQIPVSLSQYLELTFRNSDFWAFSIKILPISVVLPVPSKLAYSMVLFPPSVQ